LLSDRVASRAIIVLVEDDENAESLAGMLTELRTDVEGVAIHMPPVRGLGFFADARSQHQLNQWWEAHVPPQTIPIFVIDHRDDLAEWLVGIDGVVYVGVNVSGAEVAYLQGTNLRAIDVRSPLDYAAAVMGDLAEEGLYRKDDVDRVRALATSLRERETVFIDSTAQAVDADEDQRPDPFDLLIAMSLEHAGTRDPAPALAMHGATESREQERHGIRLPAWAHLVGTRRHRAELSDRELAGQLIRRGSTVVAVGSRKGGVGKTSHAAGVAIIAGGALDSAGRCAAIVDANLANPDAWGQLNLPAGAATVRSVVAALASNQEPPRAVHASTPALACYPESRETSEYTRTEVGMLVSHLRAKYPFIVVDLSNRLPDPTAGPEASVAAYWLEHADVLVLPSAASKQDFNGVLDYLEIPDIPPVIVASLVPRSRRNREHPLAKRYMSAIAQRAFRVVDIPDEAERVRYAGMEGVPVESVSTSLKAAYRQLAEAIVSVPQAVRR
jgi:septum formation inhibitor-activating ATPase MinD